MVKSVVQTSRQNLIKVSFYYWLIKIFSILVKLNNERRDFKYWDLTGLNWGGTLHAQ